MSSRKSSPGSPAKTRRNPLARIREAARYHQRVVRNRRKYTRKKGPPHDLSDQTDS